MEMEKKLCLFIMLIMVVQAYAFTGIIKYDSRSGKAPQEIEYDSNLMGVLSKNPDYEALWITVNRQVADWDSFDKMKQDSVAYYKNKSTLLAGLLGTSMQLTNLLGKPYEDELHKWYIENYLLNLAEEKDKQEIIKDLNAGKVSKKLKKYIQQEEAILNPIYVQAEADYKLITLDWCKFYTSKGLECPSVAYKTYTDTIQNLYNYDLNFSNHMLDKGGVFNAVDIMEKEMKTSDGWDWYDGDGLVEKEEKYPKQVKYKYSPEHPEYRFIDYGVYNNKGELVRVLLPRWRLSSHEFKSNGEDRVFKQIAQMAYNQNDYDIQSEDKQTTHYIKVQLGMEEPTAAEKKKQEATAKAMAEAWYGSVVDGTKYGTETIEGKAAQNKHAAKFIGALIGGADGYYSTKGASWLSQISNDYWMFFNYDPYKIERIDDTTFKITYADANCNLTVELIYNYEPNGTYDKKRTITVNKLFEGAASDYKSIQRKYKDIPIPCADNPNKIAMDGLTVNINKQKTAPEVLNKKETVTEVADNNREDVFEEVDVSADFPGGQAALMSWLKSNIRYPEKAILDGARGRVIVKFIVDKNGNVLSPKIVKSAYEALNEEALRLVNDLPKFTPAKLNGANVASYYCLPINFNLP